MSRVPDAWREDRLGRLMRCGLREARSAAPSAAVWQRIARATAPPPPTRRRVAVPWSTATVLSVVMLLALALGSLSADVRLSTRVADSSGDTNADGAYGLSSAEMAIQPAIQPRPVNLTLPPGERPSTGAKQPRASRQLVAGSRYPPPEAYGWSLWPRSSELRHGPVTPLAALHGR